MVSRKGAIVLVGVLAVIALAVMGKLGGKPSVGEPMTATSFKLNTVISLTIYDSKEEALLEEALELCDYYEKIFSRTRSDSELYQLNHGILPKDGEFFVLSEPLAELVALALSYCEMSEGAFDITIEPVSSLWDFTSGKKVVPEAGEIKEAVQLVNYRDVTLDGNRIRFEKEGMGLELGAIAKGYIADKIKEFLVEAGVNSGIINLGGNVLCIGTHPDGRPFRIGLRKPFSEQNETFFEVEASGRSVVSSGTYERYFEKDGVFYHHILDPKTGYPCNNGLVSVSIISDSSAQGDALSTACFALGLEKGMKLADSLPQVQAVFVTEDGENHFSENFEKNNAF